MAGRDSQARASACIAVRDRIEIGEDVMRLGAVVAAVVGLCAVFGAAQANDDAGNPDNYPNWRGQWYRTKGVQWDTAKPPGRGQQAPLIPEYQARYEVSL